MTRRSRRRTTDTESSRRSSVFSSWDPAMMERESLGFVPEHGASSGPLSYDSEVSKSSLPTPPNTAGPEAGFTIPDLFEPPPHYSQPHEEYHYDCGDVSFLVEDKVFKLHSYLLRRESSGSIFLPERPFSGLRTVSHETPITLYVDLEPFETFLRALYHPLYRPFTATLDEWISILDLATRWEFTAIRDMAILELDRSLLDPVKKIVVGQTFCVQEWLPDCYIKLCERATPLSFEEAEAVGVRVTSIISQAREKVREETTWFYSPDVSNIVTAIVRQV